MANITITNTKTIKRKLRNILLAGLVLGGLYTGRDLIEKASDWYKKHNPYSVVESQIEDEGYIKAKEKLLELKAFLKPEETNNLEARIQSIHPDSLLVRSQTESLERQKELTLKARQVYLALGKEPFEANKKYVEASLNELIPQLNHSFVNRNERAITGNLELVKNDTLFKELINFNTKKPKIYEPILNNFISATANYVKSFDVNSQKYSSYFQYIKPAITYTLDILFKIDPSRHRDHVKFLIDAYAELAKTIFDKKDNEGNVLRTITLLKRLQETYKYKNSIIDEDKLLIEYASKL